MESTTRFLTLCVFIFAAVFITSVAPQCCQFETANICDFTNRQWIWSGDETTIYIPPHSGNYLWTNALHAVLTTPTQQITELTTTFNVSFFTDTDHASVHVYFQEDGYESLELAYLGITVADTIAWHTKTIEASNLCVNGPPCSGTFSFKPVTSIQHFDGVAIDNVGLCT